MRFFLLACLSLCIFSTGAQAQVSIAVVNIESILGESKAAISIKKQVEKYRRAFLGEVKRAEDKLRTDQQAIEKQRSELTKEELLKKAQEFEEQRIKARNLIHAKKTKLDESYTEAMDTLTKTIYEVSQEIADEDGIDLIITRQNIIVGNMSLDITKKVMKRMNKKLSKLTLNIK